MINRGMRYAAGILVSAVLVTSTPIEMFATEIPAGAEYMKSVSTSYAAGALSAINESVVLDFSNDSIETDVSEQNAPVVADVENNIYSNIAIAQVDAYLNVRAEANADAEVLGKLYSNGAATVLETLDGWYKIESGNVVGYVSADYVIVGDAEVCEEASERIATVTTTSLKLRKEASTEAGVYTLLGEETEVNVLDESVEGWVKIEYDSYEGYVSSDYVTVETVYTYAESREEEQARLEAEAEERRREEEARQREEEARRNEEESRTAASSQKTQTSSSSSNSNKTYNPPAGGSGQAVADYAVQFIGNPYVWGGTSLTNGADCSGFIMSVYGAFGVSLPHSSSALRNVGYAVSESDVQPGDIICYSGHVAIYIGNGKIVHAANKDDGIKISNWNYTNILAIRRIY